MEEKIIKIITFHLLMLIDFDQKNYNLKKSINWQARNNVSRVQKVQRRTTRLPRPGALSHRQFITIVRAAKVM